jgi:outer membrane protein TolC
MRLRIVAGWLWLLALGGGVGQGAEVAATPITSAARLVRAETDAGTATIIAEVLERNPGIAAVHARARAAGERPLQAAALPDPVLGVGAFLLPPETRTGPQRISASLSQTFPWSGKRSLGGRAAGEAARAAALRGEVEALDQVTEARRLLLRLAFVDEAIRLVRADRETLGGFEELARTRYTTGQGIGQAVIKIQAEMTRVEARRLDLEAQRASLVAAVNGLRDRPRGTPVPVAGIPVRDISALDLGRLRQAALDQRPEMAEVQARIDRRASLVELARKEYRPDVTVGLTYTLVDRRNDPQGEAWPPPDDGDDILGVAASFNLPIRKNRLDAGVREALEHQAAVAEEQRAVIVSIDRSLADLLGRIPLARDQWRLFDNVLLPQAEESLRSARYSYETGQLGVLDLLDAERLLLEVRLGAARVLTDLDLALVDLERAIGGPLSSVPGFGTERTTP